MPELTPEQAIALLQQQGGYGWLIGGAEIWSTADVTKHLNESGISVSNDTVIRWFKSLPSYQDYGKLGLFASRNVLLVYFASKIRGGQSSGAAGM